jgi:hypothetical protein
MNDMRKLINLMEGVQAVPGLGESAQAGPVEYPSTADAYDACQIEEISDGTIIVVPSEKVVGIAGTWPVALTKAHGEFHQLNNPDMSVEEKARVLKVAPEVIERI